MKLGGYVVYNSKLHVLSMEIYDIVYSRFVFRPIARARLSCSMLAYRLTCRNPPG
jgi:hypothetical protein